MDYNKVIKFLCIVGLIPIAMFVAFTNCGPSPSPAINRPRVNNQPNNTVSPWVRTPRRVFAIGENSKIDWLVEAGFSKEMLATSALPSLQNLGITQITFPDGTSLKLDIASVSAVVERGRIDYLTFYSRRVNYTDAVSWLNANQTTIQADFKDGIEKWTKDIPKSRVTISGWAIAQLIRHECKVGISVANTQDLAEPYAIGVEIKPPY